MVEKVIRFLRQEQERYLQMSEQDNVGASVSTIDFDIVFYDGDITVDGYERLCNEIEKSKRFERCVLVIETPGGDPHAGFRIARALHHHYQSFDVFIPRYCKSAGTLICLGASRLYMDDRSELGPLDIQVKKEDEIIGRNSGLDIVQALNNLQTHAISSLREVLLELTANAGLSTKVASEIACKLTTGVFEPIYAQIDPIKIAEMQRATSIAFSYGKRLEEKSNNLRANGLERLVLSYPSHGFVIDRKEARTIFEKVEDAKGILYQKIASLFDAFKIGCVGRSPSVQVINTEKLMQSDKVKENEPRDTETNTGGDGANEQEVA